MENKPLNESTGKRLDWHKPGIQILTISQDTSLANSLNTPILVDKE